MPGSIQEIQKPQSVVDVDRLRRMRQPVSPKSSTFSEVLREKVSETNKEVRFSNHAMDRLRLRNIMLTTEDSKRLEGAVDRVEQKGGRESLVLMDNLAFVVSVTNRTVITAVDGSNLRENVFTNIDSAIMV